MINRRRFVQGSVAALAASRLAAPAIAQGAKIKLGYVSPRTGPFAAFAEADKFVIDKFVNAEGSDFEVIVKNSESNPSRANEVARELIVEDEINLMLVSSTPETTNPVTTVCENEEIPVLSTVAPWEAWFIGQQSDQSDPTSWTPFNYAYHFFWGLQDIIAVFTNMWAQLETNKKVGGLFPNDGDGNAWSGPQGFPPKLEELGYELTDPGRYENGVGEFNPRINEFKSEGVDIITGVPIPPDFTVFWNQMKQNNFTPKAASIGKAILFPSAVENLGEEGHNLSSEVWWSPSHPFSSSLTGQSSRDLAEEYTAVTEKQWTQPIGFAHALFEVAKDAMGRVSDVSDGDAVAAALAATQLDTIVGRLAWDGARLPPFGARNVARTPLVGGQWRHKGGGKYDLVIVDNKTAPSIPTGGEMEAIR
ncbi:MAG: ABC transporter substrate-binding protein [Alphaproteobacteria bacterium]|nr:ABC transporter substrate-binding protein [Alphaproteobacteria bacterium]MDA8003307.1 ABC transporter substrate-binding protein [Alphaproteobacteria bacterium]MDA8005015.1 ABC transporter substrate-binding protein [Alphaproteobacteria bacterium]MDA8012372.1 ABC transporter substrate-binding protein [Alphaproteobacteria bacterium]